MNLEFNSLPSVSWLPNHLMIRVAFLLLVSLASLPVSLTAQAPPPARVVVADVVEESVISGQTFVATIMPLRRAVIGSAVDGRVLERNVDEGDRVEKSQPLVQLLTNTIALELKAAEAELRLRQQELIELENGFRANEIEQAKAKWMAAEANSKYRRLQRDRLQKLMRSQAISEGDLDEAEAAFDQSSQTLLDLKAGYDLAVEGPRPEKIEQARAIVARQQAQVELIGDRIKKYTIISRFDGYVVAQHVEIGAWVKTGDPIMEVIELDSVELKAYVPELYVPFVRPGTEVRVEVPSVPDHLFSGVVRTVIPQADTQARTFPVLIRVKNEISEAGPLLKSGLYARVELPTGSRQTAMMVPKDALVLGGPKPMVYVIQPAATVQPGQRPTGKPPTTKPSDSPPGPTAVPVPVELGIAQGELIQVRGDLKPGQQVVIEGNERLRPGQSVIVTRR